MDCKRALAESSGDLDRAIAILREEVTREGETSGVGVLSDRELEVFRLIGEGHSSREIAGRLGISIKTVGTHRSNAMRKLGVTSPSRLAHLAVKWVSGLRRGAP